MTFLGINQFDLLVLRFVCWFITGILIGSPKVVLWRSQESNLPWFTRHRFIPYTTAALAQKMPVCGFPVYKPVPPVGLRFVCWFYVGNTQRLTESGFMEKQGIDPVTPGLQGIRLSTTPWRLRHTEKPGCFKIYVGF